MDETRSLVNKLTKDKMIKLRRNYIAAFNHLEPITVGTFLKEGQTFEDLNKLNSDHASSYEEQTESEGISEQKSESYVHSLETKAVE